MLFVAGACSCVRWIGMPALPTGTANDTALYGVTNKKWGANMNRARNPNISRINATLSGKGVSRASRPAKT